tara:strand:+ start:567 stop:941 length:375 start_codon:yes stop_codon:yes gene_type:complete
LDNINELKLNKMSENKELLEATVKGLQDKVNQLNVDLKSKQKELEDYNKPLLLNDTYAHLEDIISNTIGEYQFDCGEFEYEFNLSYDNKLELSDLTFNDHYSLAEAVMKAIDNHFKVEEDETNQ